MGFGSSTGGGTNEGFGGNESGIGGGSSGGGGNSSSGESTYAGYSQSAMDEALAASDVQATMSNMEHGLSALGFDSEGIGSNMAEYGRHDSTRQALDESEVARTNNIRSFAKKSLGEQLAAYGTSKKEGWDTSFMGEGAMQGAIEGLANSLGSKMLGGAATAVAGPAGAALASQAPDVGSWGMDVGARDFVENGMTTGQYTSVAPGQRTAEMGYQDSTQDERYLDSLMRRIRGMEV